MSIKVNNVSFTYLSNTPNAQKALDDVSLEIKTGSFTGIVGHTGSGKSTLIQMFNALLCPSEGTIEVDDFVITDNKKKIKNLRELRKHVGLVFQFPEYQLFDETVEKDVAFGLKNFGVSEEEALKKARKTLISLGIKDKSYFTRSPFDLSGGEKRKVAFAGILSINPDILILDEPTAGLDPKSSEDIMNLVKKLHEEGKTIIMITHDMDLLFKYCNHAIVLKKGKVAFDGNPTDLFLENQEELSLDIPKSYLLANILKKKGMKIPKEIINDFDKLMDYIAQNGGKKHE